MASKEVRQRRSRSRSIECLEDRRVMAADGLAAALGGAISHHVVDSQPVFQHGALLDAPLEQHAVGGPAIEHHGLLDSAAPQLGNHGGRDADFWLDPSAERDTDALLGDIERTLASAHGLSGLTQVRNNYGFIGSGQTVAIIDSGIAYNHLALGNGLGANYRVVGGWDFTENDANPYDDGPEGSHGTHVAGIVGADRAGTVDDGVAPGVDLVGLRVFNDAGDGYFSWVESALRWVHQNRNAYENPITAVNLSIGTTWNSNTVPDWSTIEDEFAQLKADGIFVSVSAGNSFLNYNAPGLSYPAASPNVVPVMSLDDNGSLSYFSQRHTRAIAAPGRWIVSTVPDYIGNNNGVGDDYASFSGTSMAAPYVAGASVLIREAMQFVGYANINQDTIYNHMMSTADTFLDSATGQNYKRLNMASALTALMPADEYGSTSGAAHNLGTVSGTSQISGLIGTLSDVDYFRFTAAATGTVRFTATTSHNLAANWTGAGVASGSNGQVYTLDVVAGQSYTVGLSTSGGIGYYQLAIQSESSFSYVNWGAISQTTINNVASAGEAWYRVQASRTGFLTGEAFFNAAGGNVDISLYNSNLQWLANGVVNAAGERLDWQATAGNEYFLRVAGSNSDIDFRLTNLVVQLGSLVNVVGTAAADSLSFAAGNTELTVGVNGTTYQFVRGTVTTVNFTGGAGTDVISLSGSAGDETATLRAGEATLAGSNFTASATGVETVIANGGGGSGDIAKMYDTAGDDRFYGYASVATLNGTGLELTAVNFDRVQAYASQGFDRAYLYDSGGNDTFGGWSDRAVLYGAGYRNDAYGFDRTYAYAGQGTDKAYFYDSAGNDTYGGWSDRAIMYGPGYRHDAYSFERTFAYSTQGSDRAYFYDSAGDDTYGGWSDRALMYGSGYRNEAFNFARTYATATQGNDRATLYDSAGDDALAAAARTASLTSSTYRHELTDFDEIAVNLINGGNNTTDLAATDFALNLVGQWT